MSITKHYCDYCEKEIDPNKKTTLEAKLSVNEPWRGDVDKTIKGEFCTIACAGAFVQSDGSKAAKEFRVEPI